MYLSSAGRLYSRKSSEEEFNRYVYDYGVVDKLRSALNCLFELPIKPLNVEEYFAEFFENSARDLIEISILRAELCNKQAEADDVRLRCEHLATKITELKKKSVMKSDFFHRVFQSAIPDGDEKKYEIMRRFFKDIQEYHSAIMSHPGTVVLKEEERIWGSEGESRLIAAEKLVRGISAPKKSHGQSLKVDSYETFVSEMKKFDPWGLLFPYVQQPKGPLPLGDGQDLVPGVLPRNTRVQNSEPGISAPTEPDFKTGSLDDSKSVAELLVRDQTLADEILQHGEKNLEQAQCSPESGHTWDTEYWKLFMKGGDIAPNFAIRVVDSHSSIFGNWCAPNAGIQLQYFNPQRFSETSVDNDKVTKSDESQSQGTGTIFEFDSIKNSVAAKQLAYRGDAWTSAKFTSEPLPFIQTLPCELPVDSNQRNLSESRKGLWYDSARGEDEDDIIDTDVTYGDSSVGCKPRLSQRSESKSRASHPRVSADSKPAGYPKLPSNLTINRPLPSRNKFSSDTSFDEHDPDKATTTMETDRDHESNRTSRASTSPSRGVSAGSNRASQPTAVAFTPLTSFSDDGEGRSLPQSVEVLSGLRSQQDAKSAKCPPKVGQRSEHLHQQLLESMSYVRSKQQVHVVASMYPGDPCDPNQVHQFHPYPELLKIRNVGKGRPVKNLFLNFCRRHYDEETIMKLQHDFHDFSIFDDVL